MQAFTPQSPTLTVAATETSSSQAFAGTGDQVVIQNAGPNTAFVKFGASGVASTTAEFPVFSGSSVQLSRAPTQTHVAVICAATQTATVYITNGAGD